MSDFSFLTVIIIGLFALLVFAIWNWVRRVPRKAMAQAAPVKQQVVAAPFEPHTEFISREVMFQAADHSSAPESPATEILTVQTLDEGDSEAAPVTEFLSREELLGLATSPRDPGDNKHGDSAPTAVFSRAALSQSRRAKPPSSGDVTR